jgi:protoporphyrinogen oxidase
MNSRGIPVVILGAGPAGLGAALQLSRRGCFDVTVVERNREVGGNAGSFEVAGLRVDYGSHRLHPSCAPEILADIHAMLGQDLLDRPRHGRIRLRSRWVHFPLKPIDLVFHLPPSFIAGVIQDSLKKLGGKRKACTFKDVLEQGLGSTICRDFYFPYAQKIWGVPADELDAEQARRRVAAGSLGKMIRKVLNAVPGLKPPGSGRFFYPRSGFGSISEAYANAAVRAGSLLRLETTVTGIEVSHNRVNAVRVRNAEGEMDLPACQVLSTIPISMLPRLMAGVPSDVMKSACGLKSRAMILIYLVLDTPQFTEYDAHYFPEPEIAITRLSEPKNYGLGSLPGTTVLCAELPCSIEDPVWKSSDRDLQHLVMEALKSAGLPCNIPIRAVCTRRLPQAYPIYTREYHEHFDRIDNWLNGIEGIMTFGRQGLFAHDNTHHALAMAYAANKCLDDQGKLDRKRWAAHRLEFQNHVVED